MDSILYARLIISEDWIFSASIVGVLYEAHMLLPWTASTTLIILRALYVRLPSVPKTVTMSMMEWYIVTITIQRDLLKGVMAVKRPSSSNLSRSSGMGRTNTGTQNVT